MKTICWRGEMKKYYPLRIVFLLLFTSLIAINVFSHEPSFLNFDFFGTWYYEENEMYYNISDNKLVAIDNRDNTGFTVKIITWEFIINDGYNSNYFPNGFRITGEIEEMTGCWWIDIGDVDTWTWYIKIDKSALITDDGTIYNKK